jgi:hypothetical protein
MPDKLAERTVYISIPFATAVHLCVCGCGTKVITPISPTGWELRYDGDTVSFKPSIGNWSFNCRSHYWITRNRAVWAGMMTEQQIMRGRERDRELTEAYFSDQQPNNPLPKMKPRKGKFTRFREWLESK